MRIQRAIIENFKSIEHIDVRLRCLSLLVGSNNAGKSNIIEALRVFLGDAKLKPTMFRNVQGEDVQDFYIEVEYQADQPEEIEDLPEKYKLSGDRFRVRYTVVRGGNSEYRGYVLNEDGKEVLDEKAEYFGAVGRGKLGTAIHIPAIRELQDEVKTTGTTTFGKLLKEIVSEEVKESEAYAGYVVALSQLERHIRGGEPAGKRVDRGYGTLADVEATLNEELRDWNCEASIRLVPIDPSKLTATSAEIKIREEGTAERDPDLTGQGLQRSIVNALITVWADAVRARERRKAAKAKTATKKVFRPPATIVLFEEPEAYLAVPQQRRTFDNLRTLSSQGMQVLASTHSPVFLENTIDDFSSLHVTTRTPWTTVRTISPELQELLANQKFGRTFRFHCWLNAERNAAFFADRILLVEGATDKAVYLWLMAKHRRKLGGVTVFDCGPKHNIPHFMRLFGDFGLRHVVVHDDDHNKVTDKLDHKALNKAIQDASNEFTVAIIPIVGDMEEFLGIAKAPSYKKTTEAVLHLEQTGISADAEEVLLKAFEGE